MEVELYEIYFNMSIYEYNFQTKENLQKCLSDRIALVKFTQQVFHK